MPAAGSGRASGRPYRSTWGSEAGEAGGYGFRLGAGDMHLYRAGTKGQQNLTPRPVDTDGFSAFDSMAALLAASHVKPGGPVQVFDPEKLIASGLQVVPTPPPAGHVSVRPATKAELDAWIAARAPNPESPLTVAVRNAIVRTEYVP